MGRIVDEIVSIYIAEDKHSATAEKIARAQERAARVEEKLQKQRAATANAERSLLRVKEQGERVASASATRATREANQRAAVARAILAETRATEALTRAQERQARAASSPTFASRFRNGFGSTRFDFGAASPLFSSFSRGGVAGGLGAITAAGLAGGVAGAGNLFSAGAGMIGQGLSAIPGFAGSAVNAAQTRQSREARLRGLIGPGRAAGALRAAEGVAAPSPFTTGEMADAAVQLEAFGVRADRALPIIGRLGTAMGAGAEQLQMYTKAIGELGTGNMIDKDVLAAMGLTRADFAAQGIQFDGNGALLSSAEETLTALDNIVKTRFSKVIDEMANTMESKRASLSDAGEKAMVAIGNGIARAEGPFVDRLTRLLTGAVDSGVLAESVNRSIDSLMKLTGTGTDAGMANFAAGILTAFETIPEYIRVALKNGQEFWMMMKGEALQFGATLSAAITYGLKTAQNAIAGAAGITANPLELLKPGEIARRLMSAGQNFNAQQSVASGAFQNSVSAASLYSYSPQYAQMPDFGKRQAEIAARLQAGMSSATTPGFPNVDGNFLTRGSSPQASAMEAIAKNTAETADNTGKAVDIQRVLFGGADRAGSGIEIASLSSRAGGGRGGSVNVRLSGAASSMERALVDLINEVFPQVLRAHGFHGAM